MLLKIRFNTDLSTCIHLVITEVITKFKLCLKVHVSSQIDIYQSIRSFRQNKFFWYYYCSCRKVQKNRVKIFHPIKFMWNISETWSYVLNTKFGKRILVLNMFLNFDIMWLWVMKKLKSDVLMSAYIGELSKKPVFQSINSGIFLYKNKFFYWWYNGITFQILNVQITKL